MGNRSVGIILVWLTAALPGRAELQFAQPVDQVGEVASGTTLKREFTFVNRGTETVDILEVRGSCGCLRPRLTRRSYGPGERGSLTLEVNTLTQPEGPHAWQARVSYQEGRQAREAVLRVVGTVRAAVTIRPAVLTLHTDHAAGHELLLTDHRARPLAVEAVHTSTPQLRARLAGADRDADGHAVHKVRVDVGPDFPDGKRDEEVVIVTNDPQYRELRMSVTVVKQGRQGVTAFPSAVTLTAAAGQAVPARLVRLRARGGQAVEVEGVEADHPAIAAAAVRGPGDQATVKVTVDRSKVTGHVLQGAVRVRLKQPAAESITLPVTCTLP